MGTYKLDCHGVNPTEVEHLEQDRHASGLLTDLHVLPSTPPYPYTSSSAVKGKSSVTKFISLGYGIEKQTTKLHTS